MTKVKPTGICGCFLGRINRSCKISFNVNCTDDVTQRLRSKTKRKRFQLAAAAPRQSHIQPPLPSAAQHLHHPPSCKNPPLREYTLACFSLAFARLSNLRFLRRKSTQKKQNRFILLPNAAFNFVSFCKLQPAALYRHRQDDSS